MMHSTAGNDLTLKTTGRKLQPTACICLYICLFTLNNSASYDADTKEMHTVQISYECKCVSFFPFFLHSLAIFRSTFRVISLWHRFNKLLGACTWPDRWNDDDKWWNLILLHMTSFFRKLNHTFLAFCFDFSNQISFWLYLLFVSFVVLNLAYKQCRSKSGFFKSTRNTTRREILNLKQLHYYVTQMCRRFLLEV